MSEPAPNRLATFAEIEALPRDLRAEVINGALVIKEGASNEHNDAQGSIATQVSWRFKRGSGDDERPGGWWVSPEAEVEYEAHEVYRHDIAGWRRDRVPDRPSGRPVRVRVDWACEVLSPSNASNDTVLKFRTLHRCGVSHYWIADVVSGTITVYEWAETAYMAVVVARRGERLRLPPFDAVELDIGVLLGDDPTD